VGLGASRQQPAVPVIRAGPFSRSVLASSTAPQCLELLLGRPPDGAGLRYRWYAVSTGCVGGAACSCFWLDSSEEVGLDTCDGSRHGRNPCRRRASTATNSSLAWATADCTPAGLPGQLFALGVDLAADHVRHLVPDGTDIDGPVPVGDEPAGLLRSAELLLRRLAPMAAGKLLMIFLPRWQT